MRDCHPFDPFNDRLARDLRNGLSRALLADLPGRRLDHCRQVAEDFRARPLADVHRRYLDERLQRYEQALTAIADRRLGEPFHQALALWDLGLFFEVHEVLEAAWHKSPEGPAKSALQGMILAAGSYLHLEAGRRDSAAKLAAKAIRGLDHWQRAALPPFPDRERLITALEGLEPPPRLADSLPG